MHREDGPSREHVKHGSPDLVRENGKGLPFAVLFLNAREQLLPAGGMAQKQHGSFGERPLEMDIPHFRATRAELLARRLMHALDQSRVGRTFLHAIKPRDVVNLVQDRECQDFPDARDRSQTMERIGIVALRLPNDREFEVPDEGVVLIDSRQVDLDTLPHTRIGDMRADPVTVGRIGEASLEGRQVVLRAGILNVRQEFAALPDQVQPTPHEIARRPHARRVDVGPPRSRLAILCESILSFFALPP